MTLPCVSFPKSIIYYPIFKFNRIPFFNGIGFIVKIRSLLVLSLHLQVGVKIILVLFGKTGTTRL
jgi:hypothetical protein